MKKWVWGLLIFTNTIAAGKDLYTGFRGSRVSGFTADYLVSVRKLIWQFYKRVMLQAADISR